MYKVASLNVKGATGTLALTAAGRAAHERLVVARHERLNELLARWEPEIHAEVQALLQRLAAALVEQLPRPPNSNRGRKAYG